MRILAAGLAVNACGGDFLITLLLFNVPARTLLQRGLFLAVLWPLTAFLQLLMSVASQTVHVSDVTLDLIPLERIVCVTAENSSEHFFKVSASERRLSSFDATYPQGECFTQAEREEVRTLDTAGRFQPFGGMIAVQSPIAFALALFLGLILTLFLKVPFYSIWVR